MPKPLIRVIGSLNVDFTTSTPRHPGPGETLLAHSHRITPGGKGANQAAACGRSSITKKLPAGSAAPGGDEQDVLVEMVGAVGAGDPYWTTMMQPMLNSSGVSTRLVREVSDVGGTGTATIIVDENAGGENRILVVLGANVGGMRSDDDEVWKRVMAGRPDQAQEGDGGLPDVIVLQGEIPRDTVMQVIERLGAKGVEVVFNPAPVWPEGIDEHVWKYVTTLIVNETEMTMLAEGMGFKREASVEEFSLQHLNTVADLFHSHGMRTVIVTLGSKGAYFSHQSPATRGLVPSVKVAKVVDTTAAGDTFVGRYAAALARWKGAGSKSAFDVEGTVKAANEGSALTVQRSGAMESIPFGWE